jgi:hypothetical protein
VGASKLLAPPKQKRALSPRPSTKTVPKDKESGYFSSPEKKNAKLPQNTTTEKKSKKLKKKNK